MPSSIEQRLALRLAAKPPQVAAAITLLDEGTSVPFIARYRRKRAASWMISSCVCGRNACVI